MAVTLVLKSGTVVYRTVAVTLVVKSGTVVVVKSGTVVYLCYLLQRSGFYKTPTNAGAVHRAVLHGFLHTFLSQDEI